MEKRVTIRDIALALGFHHSTVSLGLRDDRRLPEETRRKVQEAARRLGYRPDPMVQALAAYRTAVKPASDHGTLAWLSNEREPLADKPSYNFTRYLNGARRCAAELGYRLEEFALRAPGMTPQRMVRILQARGISGIIVAPMPLHRIRARIRLDWSGFSAVGIGFSLAWPPISIVTNHQFGTVQMAFRELISLGYRRIGIAISREVNGRCNGAFLGGYHAESMTWPAGMQVPPFVFSGQWAPAALRRWYREHKPEAIIFHDAKELQHARDILNVPVPQKLGMVSLHITSSPFAYVDQNDDEIGRAAVDTLVSLIHRNEKGIPPVPRKTLIESTWHHGPTVRRVNAGGPAKAVRRILGT